MTTLCIYVMILCTCDILCRSLLSLLPFWDTSIRNIVCLCLHICRVRVAKVSLIVRWLMSRRWFCRVVTWYVAERFRRRLLSSLCTSVVESASDMAGAFLHPIAISHPPPVDIIWCWWWLSGGYEGKLSELFCAVFCTTVVHSDTHTYMSNS